MRYRTTTDEELALVLEEGEGFTLEFKRSVNSALSNRVCSSNVRPACSYFYRKAIN